MWHRYASWASATAAVAAAAMLGCSTANDPNPGVNNAAGAAGSLPPMLPSGVGAGGSTPVMTPPAGAAGISAGTGGAATAAGTTGAMIAGTGGQAPAAGSGGAAGGTAVDAGAGGGADAGTTPVASAGTCGPEATASPVDLGDPMKRGPWMPTMKASTGPSGSSTLFYPMELGKDGVKHPVFHWGCGAGSTPSQYADHLSQLASYGFVVIANASGSMPAKASLDWLLAENEKMGSMFYQKLDPMKVATGGHSLGALETMQFAADPRLQSYVLVCGGAGGGGGAANIHAPSIFLGGEGEGGTANFEGDYAEVTKAASVFVTKTSTDHIYCARNNLAPWVAFMRWNLCGEDKWKKEFMPDGAFCKSPWLACKSKGVM